MRRGHSGGRGPDATTAARGAASIARAGDRASARAPRGMTEHARMKLTPRHETGQARPPGVPHPRRPLAARANEIRTATERRPLGGSRGDGPARRVELLGRVRQATRRQAVPRGTRLAGQRIPAQAGVRVTPRPWPSNLACSRNRLTRGSRNDERRSRGAERDRDPRRRQRGREMVRSARAYARPSHQTLEGRGRPPVETLARTHDGLPGQLARRHRHRLRGRGHGGRTADRYPIQGSAPRQGDYPLGCRGIPQRGRST